MMRYAVAALVAAVASAQWPLACDNSTDPITAPRCPATQTCAPNGFSMANHLGCCPAANAVSCNDYQCCPSGTTCVLNRGSNYGAVYDCVAAGAPNVTSRCACKPGPPLPMDSKRKNVLIIGDSLSIGYTPPVAALLADIALVQHAPWDTQDGGAEESSYFEQCLDNWLASPSGIPIKVDLIWFNSGMHNLALPGQQPVPGQGDTYLAYPGPLAAVTARLVDYATRTNTKLLYGLTTPWLNLAATDAIITGILNPNATAIMNAYNITIIDQHTPM